MAIIKCKMCGGDLNLTEGQSVMECEYCGTQQTVPNVDDEKKLTLFARANRLRMGCEFDKAAGVYESIVADFSEEAEAYWGLLLCKYGIEYVDDPATGKKVPTCHRSSFDSVMDDPDLEQALENADAVARRLYREEAKTMEELRRGIIEVSGKEEPYDIFVCYKETDEKGERTIDSVIAQDVYDALTDKGYRVFFSRITLEDKLGQEYEPYIFAALNSAKIMLAFGTDYEYYNAVWVKNEWSRFLKLIAADKEKHLIPCYKGIDAYDMPKEFAKLQAQDMGKVGAIQDLLRGIEKLLPKQSAQVVQTETVVVQQTVVNTAGDALVKRGMQALEDGEWKRAEEFFEQALNLNAECSDAFLGKVLRNNKIASIEQLERSAIDLSDDRNFTRALQYAVPEQREKLEQILAQNKGNIRRAEEERRKEEERRRAEEERRRVEEERKREEAKVRLRDIRKRIAPAVNVVAAGYIHTVGLKLDGTVVAEGDNDGGQCNVSDWTDIVAVAANAFHTVGVKSDGTVVATGDNDNGQCNVSDWTDIVAVATNAHTVGLRSDGTVLAVGWNKSGQCNVSSWRDIVAVSAGDGHTVGLKSDGTVVAEGDNDDGQCNVSKWTDIVAVAAAENHTVGLKSDGTVMAIGWNKCGQCDVSGWRDIVAVSAGDRHTVGLKSDGTVVSVGDNEDGLCDVSGWTDIVAVSTSDTHTVGLKLDGTVVVDCDVSDWKLFNSLDTLEQERAEAKRKAAEERAERERKDAEECARREATLEAERIALQQELANLKGLFSGFRRKEIESRLAQIYNELAGLQ